MILPFLVECNYNCLLCEPPLHLGGQSLCAGHLILGLPVRPAPCTGEGEAGLRARHNIRVRRIDKEILDPIIRSSPGSVTAQTPGLGDSQLGVARPGPGSRRSRPGLETATKQTVILPPLSSLLQHRRQQHCCQHTGRTLHTTLQNSTLARSNISCTFLYLYCEKDFTKQCFQSNLFLWFI